VETFEVTFADGSKGQFTQAEIDDIRLIDESQIVGISSVQPTPPEVTTQTETPQTSSVPVVDVEGIPSVIVDGVPVPLDEYNRRIQETAGVPTYTPPGGVTILATDGDAIRKAYWESEEFARLVTEGKALEPTIEQKLALGMEVPSQEQFNYAKEKGLIPEEAKLVELENGKWGYTVGEAVEAVTEFVVPLGYVITREQLDYLRENDPEVYNAINELGYQDAFKKYGDRIVGAINKSDVIKYETNLQEKSPELYGIYQNAGGGQSGVDAINNKILEQVNAFEAIPKQYIVDNRDGTVSILMDKYISDGNSLETLVKAGLDEQSVYQTKVDIDKQMSQMQIMVQLETGRYITKDLSEQTGLPEGSTFAGIDSNGNPTYYPRNVLLDSSIESIETYLAEPKGTAKGDSIYMAIVDLGYSKPLDLETNFWGLYIDENGKVLTDEEKTKMLWDGLNKEQKDKVAEVYLNDLYKTNDFAELIHQMEKAGSESFVYSLVTAPVVLIASPIAKTVTKQPVSGEEWAVGGATAVLTVLSLGGGSFLSSTFGLGGKLATSAMVAGAGGIYAPSTIALVQNPDASVRDKAIAVAMNTLVFAGAFSSVVGLKTPELVNTAKTTVAKAIEPSGVKVSLPVKIGEGISSTRSFFIELPNRVMSIPEAVKYYAKELGLKTEQIAELAKKGLLEVTPQMADRIAVNVVKAGINIENRVLSIPEAIKYYTEDLGIKANNLYELAKRGLLEVTPEQARILANDISTVFNKRVLTVPEAISYYTNELKMKAWQVYDIAKRGLLEVTPEIAKDIAKKYEIAQISLENRIMSVPEAIKYYTEGLRLDAIHLAELTRKGLLEVTPQQARMIANKIASEVVHFGVGVERRVLTASEAISYYANELKLKASDIVKMAEKNWGDIAYDNVVEISRKVQSAIDNVGERIVNIPEIVDYYMKGLEIKVGKIGADLSNKITTALDDIYSAMRDKSRETILKRAHDLELMSAEIPDEALSRIVKEQALDIQKNVDGYMKMAEKAEFKGDKVVDNLKANEQRLQSYNEFLETTRPMKTADIMEIPKDITGKLGETELYKAGELPRPKGDVIGETILDIEREMKGSVVEGEIPRLSSAEMDLYKKISDDTLKLNEVYNKPGNERLIADLINRIQENTTKLAEIKGQTGLRALEEFKVKLESRLKELGYTEREISLLSENDKLDIVANNRESPPKGIEPKPVEPSEKGGGIATKEKVETKPKTETLTEEELQKLKEKVKPEVKPEEKIITETKTITETPRPTETPFRLPQVVGVPYHALVWENGRIVVKEIVPEKLTEGFTEIRVGTQVVYAPKEETYEEAALRQRVTTEQAIKMIEEARTQYKPTVEQFPEIAKPSPSPEPTPIPQPQPTPYPYPMPTPYPQPQPEPYPQPTPQPVPQPTPEPYPQPTPLPVPYPTIPMPVPIPVLEFEEDEAKSKRLEHGFITWRQGKTHWAIPQREDGSFDSDDKIPSGKPFRGTTKFATGKGSVYKTIEYVGKNPPNKTFVDLGFIQYNITSTPDGLVLEKAYPDEEANWDGTNRYTSEEALVQKEQEKQRRGSPVSDTLDLTFATDTPEGKETWFDIIKDDKQVGKVKVVDKEESIYVRDIEIDPEYKGVVLASLDEISELLGKPLDKPSILVATGKALQQSLSMEERDELIGDIVEEIGDVEEEDVEPRSPREERIAKYKAQYSKLKKPRRNVFKEVDKTITKEENYFEPDFEENRSRYLGLEILPPQVGGKL
jgi:hypothetical protein